MKSYVIFEKLDGETLTNFCDWLRNQERGLYRSALAELAALKKLRPVFIQQKTREQQLAWLKRMLAWKPAEQIADHLLQVWLVRRHTDMLIAFLDALGIKHNGRGVVDDLPDALDVEKLRAGVEKLFSNYSAGLVSLYLQMFQNQTPTGWPELQRVLETDERVTLR